MTKELGFHCFKCVFAHPLCGKLCLKNVILGGDAHVLLLGDVVPELGVLEEVGVAPDAHLVPSRRRLQLSLDHALPRGEREAIKMVRC